MKARCSDEDSFAKLSFPKYKKKWKKKHDLDEQWIGYNSALDKLLVLLLN